MMFMADETNNVAAEQKVDAAVAATPVATAPADEAAPQKKARKRAAKAKVDAEPVPDSGPVKGRVLLFGKYSYDVAVDDPSLQGWVNLKPMHYPNSFRRTSQKRYSKASLNIIERLANDLMRGGTGGKIGGKVVRTKGRLQGKKFTVMRIIEDAFDNVHKQTNSNPIQVYIDALENSAPIEDTTRVRYGGIISNVPVDVSASRRLDVALRNISMATIIGAFRNKRNMSEALATELMLAARNDINSYAIKRKNEIERMARSAK
jgi:small subunit ribosomal protein S7